MGRKKISDRRVLNVSVEDRDAFNSWCGAHDLTTQGGAQRVIRWFLAQEPAVQSLIMNGTRPIPPSLMEPAVVELARMLTQKAAATGPTIRIAGEAVSGAIREILGETRSAGEFPSPAHPHKDATSKAR
jgi:hypothetical protein